METLQKNVNRQAELVDQLRVWNDLKKQRPDINPENVKCFSMIITQREYNKAPWKYKGFFNTVELKDGKRIKLSKFIKKAIEL